LLNALIAGGEAIASIVVSLIKELLAGDDHDDHDMNMNIMDDMIKRFETEILSDYTVRKEVERELESQSQSNNNSSSSEQESNWMLLWSDIFTFSSKSRDLKPIKKMMVFSAK